jgi:hypothetical protein
MRFPSNHSPRLQSWIALTVTSCVALIAHASSVKVHSPAKDWVWAACSMSLILSVLSTVAHGVVFEPFVGGSTWRNCILVLDYKSSREYET